MAQYVDPWNNVYGGPANPPAPPNVEPPKPPTSIIGKSGFDYSGKWDNIGPGRTWNMGDRPPSKEDWDNFTDEQKAAFGITDIEAAREAFQEGFRNSQGGGGGAAGGGRGAIPASPRLPGSGNGNIAAAGANESSLEAMISQATRDAMSGANAPFGPKELTAIRARLLQDTSGKAKASKEALNRDMIRRGLSRSGIAVEQGAGIDRAASADYTTGLRETLVAAAQQNYQAKATALQQAQQQLDSYRSYRLNSARTANEFTIAQSQIDLAYARLKQDWNSLQAQLRQQLQIANMGNENALTIALLNLQNGGGSNPYYGGGG